MGEPHLTAIDTPEPDPAIELWSAAFIVPSGDGTWQPAPDQDQEQPDSIYAFLHQVWERDGSLFDVVATDFHDKSRLGGPWWLHWNRAVLLGEDNIEHCNRLDRPALLVESPRVFHRVPEAFPACILDWDTKRTNLFPIFTSARKGWIVTSSWLAKRIKGVTRGAVPVELWKRNRPSNDA